MYNLSQLNLLNEIILGTNYYQKDFYFLLYLKPHFKFKINNH